MMRDLRCDDAMFFFLVLTFFSPPPVFFFFLGISFDVGPFLLFFFAEEKEGKGRAKVARLFHY